MPTSSRCQRPGRGPAGRATRCSRRPRAPARRAGGSSRSTVRRLGALDRRPERRHGAGRWSRNGRASARTCRRPGWLRRTAAGRDVAAGAALRRGLRRHLRPAASPPSTCSAATVAGLGAGYLGRRAARRRSKCSRSFDGPGLSRVSGRRRHPRAPSIRPSTWSRSARRRSSGARARRHAASARLGARRGATTVRFAGATSTTWHRSAATSPWTRALDPAFPRNAVWGTRRPSSGSTWSTACGAGLASTPTAAVGLFRGSALTRARLLRSRPTAPCPRYEQAMIGGGQLAARLPRRLPRRTTTPPAPSVVAGPARSARRWTSRAPACGRSWTGPRVYAAGTRWRDAAYDRGVGVGWFASATAFTLSLDVARGDGRACTSGGDAVLAGLGAGAGGAAVTVETRRATRAGRVLVQRRSVDAP